MSTSSYRWRYIWWICRMDGHDFMYAVWWWYDTGFDIFRWYMYCAVCNVKWSGLGDDHSQRYSTLWEHHLIWVCPLSTQDLEPQFTRVKVSFLLQHARVANDHLIPIAIWGSTNMDVRPEFWNGNDWILLIRSRILYVAQHCVKRLKISNVLYCIWYFFHVSRGNING